MKVHLSKPIFLSMGLFISHELGTGKKDYGREMRAGQSWDEDSTQRKQKEREEGAGFSFLSVLCVYPGPPGQPQPMEGAAFH